jgi:hypothetical protein
MQSRPNRNNIPAFASRDREKPRDISGSITSVTTETEPSISRIQVYSVTLGRSDGWGHVARPGLLLHTGHVPQIYSRSHGDNSYAEVSFSDFRKNGRRINSIHLLAIFIILASRCSRQFWSAREHALSSQIWNVALLC